MEAFNDEYKYNEVIADSRLALRAGSSATNSLNNPVFDLDDVKNIVGFKIIEAEIPFTFYVLNSLNNTFVLKEYLQTSVTIVLPTGNWTVSEMLGVNGVLAKALTAASLSLWIYTVELDPGQGKFIIYNQNTIVNPVPTNAAFTLDFGGGLGPDELLGFSKQSWTSSVFSLVKGYGLRAPFTFNLTGPSYLNINSIKFGSLVSLNFPGKSGPAISRLQFSSLPGQVNFWRDPDVAHYFNLEQLRSLDEFDLYLTFGSSETPIDLNGQSWSCKIALFTISPDHLVKRKRLQ